MYDVCANLVKSPTRNLNYDFPPHPIYRIPDPVLIVRKDSTIKMADLQQCNDKTFGKCSLLYTVFILFNLTDQPQLEGFTM